MYKMQFENAKKKVEKGRLAMTPPRSGQKSSKGRTKGSFNSNSFNSQLGTSDSSAIPREDARFKWIQLT